MRILHIANYSWFASEQRQSSTAGRYYAMERKITNGLIRNGHCVWDFSYRDAARYLSPLLHSKKLGSAKMNEAILALAEQFTPELILLGHCELLQPQTLSALRELLPAVKIAQWWVDWFVPHSLPHLRAKQPHLDTFFATSAPSYYRPLLGKKTAPCHYLPNITDSSAETGRAFARSDYEYDIFFAGTDAPERAGMLAQIAQLDATEKIQAGLFGFAGKPFISGAALMQAMAASKTGLNISRATDIPLYSSDRLAQLTGNGCLALTPRTPAMTQLFSEEEAAYFEDAAELTEQITRYLNDDAARRRVAEAGWKRAHHSYNERRVTRFMTEAISGSNFSERYEWLNESLI